MADNICTICLDYTDNDDYQALICNHIFHKKCILTWLIRTPTCPICKVVNIVNINITITENYELNRVLALFSYYINTNIHDINSFYNYIDYVNNNISNVMRFIFYILFYILIFGYDFILVLQLLLNYSNIYLKIFIILLGVIIKLLLSIIMAIILWLYNC